RIQGHENAGLLQAVRVVAATVDAGAGRSTPPPGPEVARPGPVGYGPNHEAWAVYLLIVHRLPTHRLVELLESLTGAKPSAGFVGAGSIEACLIWQSSHRVRSVPAPSEPAPLRRAIYAG